MSEAQISPAQTPSARLEEILDGSDRFEKLSSDSENDFEDMGTVTQEDQANIAYLESVRIPIRDSLQTDTSEEQDETLEFVLPYLEGNPNDYPLNIFGIPQLQREKHVAFLKQALGDYPSGFAMLDASRPWLVYWSLQGLSALGYDISEYRERYVLLILLFITTSGSLHRLLYPR
jgi:protein farnesyltransferase subunit beta